MALQSATGGVGIVPRELATAMTGVEFLQKLRDGALPAPPFAEVTDIWLTEVERGRVVFEGKPSPRFYNPMGSVHGGWIATVLDSAMGCAVHSVMKAGQAYTTVDMSVSLVRPVFARTGVLRCEGKLIHRGRAAVGPRRYADRPWFRDLHGAGRGRRPRRFLVIMDRGPAEEIPWE
jgi:uncharacterized protein (TIGR00369 family)